ncbi:hypothetical protein MRX96_019245 [Rhipicephalus microplus]
MCLENRCVAYLYKQAHRVRAALAGEPFAGRPSVHSSFFFMPSDPSPSGSPLASARERVCVCFAGAAPLSVLIMITSPPSARGSQHTPARASLPTDESAPMGTTQECSERFGFCRLVQWDGSRTPILPV